MLKNLSREFKKSSPTNIKQIAEQSNGRATRAYISKNGRLFGVTDKNDAFLKIEVAIVDGRQIIKVQESNALSASTVKSSAKSTGLPFINFVRICKMWFGDDQANWEHNLRLVEREGVVAFYEVVDNDADCKQDSISEQKGKTNFAKLNLPVGARLRFKRDKGDNYVVIDNRNRIISLSTGKIGTISGVASELLKYRVNGYMYFSYNGTLLCDLKK